MSMKRYVDKIVLSSVFFILILISNTISINKYKNIWLTLLHVIVIIVGIMSILFYVYLIRGEHGVT